jgi:hypothetical protein
MSAWEASFTKPVHGTTGESVLRYDLVVTPHGMICLLTAANLSSYNKGGHCCAKNKNRDYGIAVTNKSQKGEDCGYCYSGGCKQDRV